MLFRSLFGSEIYQLGSFLPSEWLLDLSYNLKLSKYYSMGITARTSTSPTRFHPTREPPAPAYDRIGYTGSQERLSRVLQQHQQEYRNGLGRHLVSVAILRPGASQPASRRVSNFSTTLSRSMTGEMVLR